jgi:hypothetical protein
MFTKNAIIASAIIVSTFSVSQAFADDSSMTLSQTGMEMGMEGGKMHMMNMQSGQSGQYLHIEKMLSNSGVITALQAAGITVPTAEEMKNFHTSMEAARKAEKELTDANKAGLETLRKTFRKQERDYLRSVGVAFPAETEIEKYQAIHEVIQTVKPTASMKKEVKKEVKKQMSKPAVKKAIKKEVKKQMNNSAE